MAQKANVAPIDKFAADRTKEAERLDLEMHARLEAGVTDSFSASEAESTAAASEPYKSPTFWQAIRKFFT